MANSSDTKNPRVLESEEEYCEKVKERNFRASSKLDGLDIDPVPVYISLEVELDKIRKRHLKK